MVFENTAFGFFHDQARALPLPPQWEPHVTLFLVPLDTRVPVFETPCLTPEEEAQFSRLHSLEHKHNFRLRRQFRQFTAELARGDGAPPAAFQETATGRPYLRERPDLSFSFSSCKTALLGGWSCSGGFGVDIEVERTTIAVDDISEGFFSQEETVDLARMAPSERSKAFLTIWCLKEAAVKVTGDVMAHGLAHFSFDPTRNFARRQGAPFGEAHRFHVLEDIGPHVGAIAWAPDRDV